MQRQQPRFSEAQKRELSEVHPWIRSGRLPTSLSAAACGLWSRYPGRRGDAFRRGNPQHGAERNAGLQGGERQEGDRRPGNGHGGGMGGASDARQRPGNASRGAGDEEDRERGQETI
ncbi:hypothetical protein AOXY_G29645, partial [Acipenser oxyrinchus oxyrinchus]